MPTERELLQQILDKVGVLEKRLDEHARRMDRLEDIFFKAPAGKPEAYTLINRMVSVVEAAENGAWTAKWFFRILGGVMVLFGLFKAIQSVLPGIALGLLLVLFIG